MAYQAKRLKIAMYALKQYYNSDECQIFVKKSWSPDDSSNRGFADLISPNPSFCSNFLVYDKKNKNSVNVSVKFVQTNPNDPKTFDGTFHYTERELKELLDDRCLYNNILTNDGTVFKDRTADSKVIIVGIVGRGDGIYISRPFNLAAFVTPVFGYEKTIHARECRESLKSGKYVDNRPILPGNASHAFETQIKGGFDPSGYSYNPTYGTWTYPWQLLGAHERNSYNLERNFPIRLKSAQEVTGAADSITDKELTMHVGIIGAGDDKHKTLRVMGIEPLRLETMYNTYTKEAWDEHKTISQWSSRRSAQLTWIKEFDPAFLIFPTYSWFKNGPLRYSQEALL